MMKKKPKEAVFVYQRTIVSTPKVDKFQAQRNPQKPKQAQTSKINRKFVNIRSRTFAKICTTFAKNRRCLYKNRRTLTKKCRCLYEKCTTLTKTKTRKWIRTLQNRKEAQRRKIAFFNQKIGASPHKNTT